jgi:hypothetical protein
LSIWITWLAVRLEDSVGMILRVLGEFYGVGYSVKVDLLLVIGRTRFIFFKSKPVIRKSKRKPENQTREHNAPDEVA